MNLLILRFTILISLGGLNCKADNSLIYDNCGKNGAADSEENSEVMHLVPHFQMNRGLLEEFGNYRFLQGADQSDNVVENSVVRKSKLKDLEKEKTVIFKTATNIINSQSIGEMIKRLKTFSQKFPKQILKEKHVKPFIGKFRGDFKKMMVNGKSIFKMANKLEKAGEKKPKRQLAAFKTKSKIFKKVVDKFFKSVNLESKKQRNKNLQIIKDHPKDNNLLTTAKRCIDITKLVSDTTRILQLIPGRINCLIFETCDDNNQGGNDENDKNGGGNKEDNKEGNEDDNKGGNEKDKKGGNDDNKGDNDDSNGGGNDGSNGSGNDGSNGSGNDGSNGDGNDGSNRGEIDDKNEDKEAEDGKEEVEDDNDQSP